jgi:hypothetical protein
VLNGSVVVEEIDSVMVSAAGAKRDVVAGDAVKGSFDASVVVVVEGSSNASVAAVVVGVGSDPVVVVEKKPYWRFLCR